MPIHDSLIRTPPTTVILDRGGLALGSRPRKQAVAAPSLTGWSNSFDAVRIAISGSIVVSISAVHMYLGPLQYTRPSLVLLIVAVLMTILRPRLVRWQNLRESGPAIAVAVFFCLTLASSIFGISPGSSVGYVTDRYIKVLIFFFLMVIATRTVQDLATMMWAFVASVGIVVILAFTLLELTVTNDGPGRLDGGATMFDANDIGMIVLMCLPICVMLFLNSRKVGKIVALAVLAGIPAVIALTGSRGALIGLGVTLPVIFIVASRISFVVRLTVAVALLLGIAAAAPAGYWKQMGTMFEPGKDYNTSDEYGRVGIAKRGIEYMLRYPIAGIGITNFARAEGTISPIARERLLAGEAVQWIAPHNTYVQVGAELGIPGLTVWLLLLFSGSVGLWRLRRRIPRRWEYQSSERRFLREAALFLPVSFIAFGVTSFFLSHAYTPPPYIIFAYHASLMVLIKRELKKDRDETRDGLSDPSFGAVHSLGRGGLSEAIVSR